MSSFTTISPDKLARLIGTAQHACPDRRAHRRRLCRRSAADPRRGPAQAMRTPPTGAANSPAGPPSSFACAGQNLAQGTAAWLAAANVDGRNARRRLRGLEGSEASAGPGRRNCRRATRRGRTVWVTRARPKIDRIACPWLIRRFVDPDAVFLFVAPSEVLAVGERFNAAPFDVENVFWSHRGELCTFDVMIEEFGLATPPLLRLATMVRAADTGAARSRARKRPGCLPLRSACRACMTTISNSSRPA